MLLRAFQGRALGILWPQRTPRELWTSKVHYESEKTLIGLRLPFKASELENQFLAPPNSPYPFPLATSTWLTLRCLLWLGALPMAQRGALPMLTRRSAALHYIRRGVARRGAAQQHAMRGLARCGAAWRNNMPSMARFGAVRRGTSLLKVF